jgi:hypothetical protein
MRQALISFLGAVIVLGLATASAAAADTSTTATTSTPTTTTSTATAAPNVSTTDSAVPTACQPEIATTAASTLATATASTADTADVESADDPGQTIRTCIEVLRASDEHGFGQIVSELAREQREDRREGSDRASQPTATTKAPTTEEDAQTTTATAPTTTPSLPTTAATLSLDQWLSNSSQASSADDHGPHQDHPAAADRSLPGN